MKGKVIQFRRGRHTVKKRHFILDFGMKNKEESKKLIGKKVKWVSPGKRKKVIKGEVKATHGNKGKVRAVFEKGMPGQALTTDVEILEEKEKWWG